MALTTCCPTTVRHRPRYCVVDTRLIVDVTSHETLMTSTAMEQLRNDPQMKIVKTMTIVHHKMAAGQDCQRYAPDFCQPGLPC